MLEYPQPPQRKKGQKFAKFVGGPADGVQWPVDKLTAVIMAGQMPNGATDETPGYCYIRQEGTATYEYLGFVCLKEARGKFVERIKVLDEEDPADWWKEGPAEDQS